MKKYMVLPFLVKLIGLIGLIRPVESQVFSWNVQVPLQSKACSGDSNLTIDWTYTPSNVNPLAIDWVKLQTDGVTVDKAVASYDGTITTFTPAADYVGRVTKPANTAEIAIANPTGTDEGVYRVTVTDSGGSTLIGEANLTFATPAVFAMTAVSGDNTATCGTVTNHGNPKAVLTMTYAGFNQSTDTDQSIIVTCTSRETVSCQLSGPAAVCAGSGASLSASATCDFKPGKDCTDLLAVICSFLCVWCIPVIVCGCIHCCEKPDSKEKVTIKEEHWKILEERIDHQVAAKAIESKKNNFKDINGNTVEISIDVKKESAELTWKEAKKTLSINESELEKIVKKTLENHFKVEDANIEEAKNLNRSHPEEKQEKRGKSYKIQVGKESFTATVIIKDKKGHLCLKLHYTRVMDQEMNDEEDKDKKNQALQKVVNEHFKGETVNYTELDNKTFKINCKGNFTGNFTLPNESKEIHYEIDLTVDYSDNGFVKKVLGGALKKFFRISDMKKLQVTQRGEGWKFTIHNQFHGSASLHFDVNTDKVTFNLQWENESYNLSVTVETVTEGCDWIKWVLIAMFCLGIVLFIVGVICIIIVFTDRTVSEPDCLATVILSFIGALLLAPVAIGISCKHPKWICRG